MDRIVVSISPINSAHIFFMYAILICVSIRKYFYSFEKVKVSLSTSCRLIEAVEV